MGFQVTQIPLQNSTTEPNGGRVRFSIQRTVDLTPHAGGSINGKPFEIALPKEGDKEGFVLSIPNITGFEIVDHIATATLNPEPGDTTPEYLTQILIQPSGSDPHFLFDSFNFVSEAYPSGYTMYPGDVMTIDLNVNTSETFA